MNSGKQQRLFDSLIDAINVQIDIQKGRGDDLTLCDIVGALEMAKLAAVPQSPLPPKTEDAPAPASANRCPLHKWTTPAIRCYLTEGHDCPCDFGEREE